MSRLRKLFRSPPNRPARKARLGVLPLEAREVPATFTVNIFDDPFFHTPAQLSLRQAITLANNNPGPDTIRLPAGTFVPTLTGADNTNAGGDFDVTGPTTFVGAGPGQTVISGNHAERLFDVLGPVAVRFADLALAHGGNAASDGGAVQAVSASVVFDHVAATDNTARNGGVINAEHGAVTVLNSQLLVNTAREDGGAVRAGTGKVFLDRTTVAGNDAHFGGGLFVGSGALTVARSDVTNNTAVQGGGGVYSFGGPVHLSNSFVRDNTAEQFIGGGVFGLGLVTSDGSRVTGNRAALGGGGIGANAVTLVRSTVSGNAAGTDGGGIRAAQVKLAGTTVRGNTAGQRGGGVFADDRAVLAGTTVSGNTAGTDGGGLRARTADLTNSTVSGNVAHRSGGGVQVARGGELLNATIAFNHADVLGGGVENLGGTVRVGNTIIANNTAGQSGRDVLGLFFSLGHNLVLDPNTGAAGPGFTNPANHDLVGIDPRLAPLADNGGPTQTHALLAGSAAIDHGLNTEAPGTDQRGVARPRDGDHNGSFVVDIGAFEA